MRAQPDWERTRVEDRSDTCGQKLKALLKPLRNVLGLKSYTKYQYLNVPPSQYPEDDFHVGF